MSVSVGVELQEPPEPEPTPVSVSVGDEINNYSCGTFNGRGIAGYHRVMYGETQEYLESLAEAGYILMYSEDNPKEEGKLTVAKPNAMPEYLKDYATNVVYDEYGNFISCSVEGLITLAENNTGSDTTHSLDICGPQPDFIYRIDPNFEDPHITITYCTDEEEAKTADTTVDPGSLDGPNPIGGGHHQYHFVQYGETQEYLESLVKEGYMMVYHEDNPPEEGKLTISKPNPEPGTITFVANPTDTTADPSNNLEYNSLPAADTTGADPAGLIAGMKSYLEEIAPKMSDIDSLTDEEVASFNETLKSFKDALRQANVATYLADTTLDPRTDTGMNPETFDPRTDTSLNDLLDSYIAALDEKEAKTADTTGTDTTTADTTDPNNYLEGPLPQSELEKLRIPDNVEWKLFKITSYNISELIHYTVSTDTTDNFVTIPSPSIDYLIETGVLLRVSDYINPETGRLEDLPIPLIVIKNSEQLAFVSTVDAETEAVTSVQVACAEDDGWRTIGTLNNADGIDWKYQAGNLTGSGAASVVWHAQELGALGVWTDGTDNWTGIAGWFDANWTMLGCGDFDGDGKDSVLMSLSGGQLYSVDLDGTLTALGGLNWSGWEFGAVGDFAGDGKADVVLFHRESGSVVMLADGNADAWTSLGQIDSSDWAIAGSGDFDSDGIDDLLVRQDSTGLIGGYAGADMSKWSVVDSDAGYYLA